MDYLKVYFSLINSRKNLTRNCYTEIHHIIPKSIFRKGLMNDSHILNVDSPNNLVTLTGREHFIAHWLLHRAFKKSKKLQGAFWAMCMISNSQEERYIPSSRAVAEAREAAALSRSVSIAKYSYSGNLLDTFNSIKQASLVSGCSESSIQNASINASKSAGGFLWKNLQIHLKKKQNLMISNELVN